MDAKRLAQQSFLLSEFLEKKVENYSPPKLQRKALVHGHCHHKAIMGMTDEEKVLSKLGLDFHVPESGCCGMAGAFGFEKDHYDVSIKVGERVLLPAVRKADRDMLIIADGFSCREQIGQTTDRHALHLAEVIQMAMHEGDSLSSAELPEKQYAHLVQGNLKRSQPVLRMIGAVSVGLMAIGGIAAWIMKKSK
jgi:Fe-S oxidoreductase